MKSNDNRQLIIESAIITNNDGHILLLKRKQDQKRAPGKLEPPGGKVEFGEDPLAALVRIVFEQTGLNVLPAKLVGSSSFVSDRDNRHIVIFYNLADLNKENPGSLELKSTTSYDLASYYDMTKLQQSELESNFVSKFQSIKTHLLNEQAINKIIDNTTTSSEIYVYSDGGSRGNPGPSATGFVVLNDSQEVIEEGGEYLGITTNNQAEYQAVRQGLKAALKYNPKKIHFKMDSLLVVNQLKGIFKVKNKDLWPIHEAIKELANGVDVDFKHVPREQNTLADGKVNEVLDSRKPK